MEWRLAGVVLLALTAGCGDVFGGDRTADAFTPAPVPESGDAGSDERAQVLPGVTDDGVTDVTRLADAHEAAVAGRSYRWRYRQSSETLRPNRTVPIDRSRELVVEHERRYRYHTDSRSVDVHEGRRFFGNFTEYADGERRYQRYVGGVGDGNWAYEAADATDVTRRYGGEATEAILRFLAVDAATVSQREEAGTYRLVGVRDAVPGIGPVEEYRVRAVVTRAGFVRSLNATFVAPERQRRYAFEFTYDRVGTAEVDAPSWATGRWAVNETT